MGFYEENKDFLPKKEQLTENKVKAGIMAYLPSAILTIILVALSALGSLIQFNFEIKNIIWTTFIISLGLRLISNFLSKYVGSNIYYNKALYSKEVQGFKNDFIDAGKNIDKSQFEEYIKEYNLETKKMVYKAKKRGKIAKIENKRTKLKTLNELDYKKSRENKIKRQTKKIEELEKISNDEYVDKYIIYLRVKYQKVKSCYFLSPEEDCAINGKKYNVNFSRENTAEILKSLPLTAILVVFGALLSYDTAMGNVNALSILYDIANMTFNFILGWFIVGKKLISRTINAYINRQTFIAQFKAKTKE